MILLSGVILGIFVALLRGGDFENFGNIHIRWAWVALVALVLQAPLLRLPPDWSYVVRLGFPLVQASVLAVAWINRDLRGMWLIAAGAALNLLVIVANDGLMPVTPEALTQADIIEHPGVVGLGTRVPHSKDIILGRDDVKLWWLSDIVVLRPIRTIVSVGDIVITIGLFLFVQGVMMRQEA